MGSNTLAPPDGVSHDAVGRIRSPSRAYLLSGDKGCRARVSHIIEHAGIENRARTSVELLLAAF